MSRSLSCMCLAIIALSAWGIQAYARITMDRSTLVDDPSCIHVNLNQLYENQILELQNVVVCFDYQDLYGKEKQLTLSFYDWKQNLIARVSVPKKYGKNSYSLNLQDLGLPFNNEHFTLEVINEMGRKITSVFKLISPPDKQAPTVTIQANPISLQCGVETGNWIQFLGNIKGGKAPYAIEWTVTNSQGVLLYQPSKSKLDKQGLTTAIEVDQSPSYYVQLQITDACGEKGKQTVIVQCKQSEANANSLLFQPVPSLPIPPKP